MPEPSFRGDPYRVLGVPSDASAEAIKRRWRDLAREHHPDRAAGDPAEQARLTARMARINAAYDVLRDPVRRARHDASPGAWRSRSAEHRAGAPFGPEEAPRPAPTGPPPPPPTRPVTARFDTSATWRARDAAMRPGRSPLRGHPPRSRDRSGGRELRASTPSGPARAEMRGPGITPPTLAESAATVLAFGRYHGWTLAEIADREPTYIDWIATTITRDRDLVVRARVVAAEMDRRGVVRRPRAASPADDIAEAAG